MPTVEKCSKCTGGKLVTLDCPECARQGRPRSFTGHDHGTGSVQFRLGVHRRGKHGVRGVATMEKRLRAVEDLLRERQG